MIGDRESWRRTMGVEEEFHLVDASTRRLAPRAAELLDVLPVDGHAAELQSCVIEVNSAVASGLDELRADLAVRRQVVIDAAAKLGLGIVAAGAVPLSVPSELGVTHTPRFRQMLADYQLLAREQLICGTQVHVGIADRDEAVVVGWRLARYLPTLLAISASSPYWADGADTGYASARTLVWQRWPTTGLAATVNSAAEYDAMVADLLGTGVIDDPGMVYFDVRPSKTVPTLELRICDSCPSMDTIVLIAGLFRALVNHEIDDLRRGVVQPTLVPVLGRAAVWRAARSGLEGDLVDIDGATSRPAADMVRELVHGLRDQLEAVGDWEAISSLTERALASGSSAHRQRLAMTRRGRLIDVVDLLIAETAGTPPAIVNTDSADATLLHGYATSNDSFDEAVNADGAPRPPYVSPLTTIVALGADTLRERASAIQREQRATGVTFGTLEHGTRAVFSLDIVPRIIEAEEWSTLEPGLKQRARALDAFLCDVYTNASIVEDGVITPELLDRATGYRSSGRLAATSIRAHVSGLDLVRDADGRWLVLEDNLRVPSGVAYAIANRTLMSAILPELAVPGGTASVEGIGPMLLETLRASAPNSDGNVVVLTSGTSDSAYYEHGYLADAMDVPLVLTSDLVATDGRIHRYHDGVLTPIDVVYVRMEEDMLLSSTGRGGDLLRPGLIEAIENRTLVVANALGNGVADDKAIYAKVPDMIEYYLGEKPVIDQVQTWICADRDDREYVVENLDRLVVKPIDGFGGHGVMIGPEASNRALDERRQELMTHPERYVAQQIVSLSTHPTFDGTGFHPHHVDLRAFVHLRPTADGGRTAHVVPAALTRVAPLGTRIVNSSAGGSSKDTWLMTERA